LKSPKEIWEAALGELQVQVNKANFDTWLRDTEGLRYRDEVFTIGAPNAFVAEWLGNRQLSLIKKTLANIIGDQVSIDFVIKSQVQCDIKPAISSQSDGGVSTKSKGPAVSSNLNPRYTFNNFVTGESNRLAFAAAVEVSENPGLVYNPLFIYSDTGLGKTHLLLAIGQLAKLAGHRVLYTSAEQLTTEFVIALKRRTTEEFQAKYRNTDVLLVDDFQFLSGKVQTQECFYHIFNDLHENNCQIVATCDRPPKAICALEKRLQSRMEGGLIADIKPPDQETRLSILKIKAKQMKASVSPEVLQLIAAQFHNNVRELEGGLNRVITYAKLSGLEPDIKTAMKALSDLLTKEVPKNTSLSPHKVIEAVSSYYEVSPEILLGKRRDKKTSLARHMAMYLIREQNHHPLSEIGKILGDRDHTTVMHGCEKIAAEASINPQLAKSIEELHKTLGVNSKPQAQ
jgi:chromosomal replication initiator protein